VYAIISDASESRATGGRSGAAENASDHETSRGPPGDESSPNRSKTISFSTLQSVPVHLQLVLDSSASVEGAPLERLKTAASAAIDSLRPTDQASLVTFSHNIARGTPWTSDRSALTRALADVTAHGTTSLVDAAFATLAQRADATARTVVLLFTDGDDTASWLSPADVVDMARRPDVVVYSVNLPTVRAGKVPVESLTDWMLTEPQLYRSGLLEVLSHETGGEAFHASSTTDLRELFVSVVSRFNARYVLSYAPAGVPATGWHPIAVTVKDKSLTVTGRRGYAR
jgi:VWFA-related protein